MAKNNFITVLIIAALIVGAILLFKGGTNNSGTQSGIQSTSGDLVRTVPINGGGSFTVTYSSNHTGQYAYIIEDSVSAGCLFQNGKQTYKSVMTGDGPTSQSTTVTGNNCVFSSDGDYNLVTSTGVGNIIKFGTQTVK